MGKKETNVHFSFHFLLQYLKNKSLIVISPIK